MSTMTSSNVPRLPSNSTDNSDEKKKAFKLSIRPNTCPMKYIDVFVPKFDGSVPHAFTLGMDKIISAKGNKQKLLAGYFSTLCAILPDLTKLSTDILRNHGFEMRKVIVSKLSFYQKMTVCCFDKLIQDLSLAQLMYLPFACNFKRIGVFWNNVAKNAGITCPIYLVPEEDAKILHSALMVSGLIAQLRTEVCLALQALASTRTPIGIILTAASKCIDIEQKNDVGGVTYVLSS